MGLRVAIMKRRKLSSEELKLWEKVAKSTLPLSEKNYSEIESVSNNEAPRGAPLKGMKFQLKDGKTRRKEVFSNTSQKVKMDMGTFSKLKKGKLEPEASLDLHGMNLEQAYQALLNFIISAHNTQKRLVLVITGKGKNSDPGYAIPQRNGVLRSQVPMWLKEAKLSNLILQVEQSHRRHGGLGALYIYLRRIR